MLGYVAGVQRKEIRQGIACVKHQNMAGSDMGDDHKEYFSGDAALKAGGADNTMNQWIITPSGSQSPVTRLGFFALRLAKPALTEAQFQNEMGKYRRTSMFRGSGALYCWRTLDAPDYQRCVQGDPPL